MIFNHCFMIASSKMPESIDLISMTYPQDTTKIEKSERQLNVWIPKSLMKKLKVKGIEEDKSLKELVINALDQFL